MKNVIMLTSLLLCTALSSFAQVKDTDFRALGAPLPPLRVVDMAGVSYTDVDITEDRNFIMVLFNPTCEHCMEVAKMMHQNQPLFENNTVFFIAGPAMMEYMPHFVGKSEWREGGNFVLGVDSADAVNVLYNYSSLPQINIYDHQKRLIKTMNGEVKLKAIREYLK